MLGLIHHGELGEPPPHRQWAGIVQLTKADLGPPLAQHLACELALPRVSLLDGRGRERLERSSSRPDHQSPPQGRSPTAANLSRKLSRRPFFEELCHAVREHGLRINVVPRELLMDKY